MESVAQTYAKALFLLTQEEGTCSKILDQTKELTQILLTNDELLKFLENRVVSKIDKKTVIDNIFKDKLDKNFVSFIKLLIDKSRVQYLIEICKTYKKLYFDYNKIKEAKVYSTILLTNTQMEEIRNTLTSKYNSNFELENYIDRNLLAGVKVVIDDLVIDGSIENKLNNLKASITI